MIGHCGVADSLCGGFSSRAQRHGRPSYVAIVLHFVVDEVLEVVEFRMLFVLTQL